MSQQVHREYVVYDERQIYPEFVVTYRLDTEEEEAFVRIKSERAQAAAYALKSVMRCIGNPFASKLVLPSILMLLSSLTAGKNELTEDLRAIAEMMKKNTEEDQFHVGDILPKIMLRAVAQVAERECGGA